MLESMTRTRLVALSVVLLLSCPPHAHAKAVAQQFEDLKLEFTGMAGDTAKTIDLVITGATKFNIALTADGFDVGALAGGKFTLTKKNGVLNNGDTVTIRVRGLLGFNKPFQIQSVFFVPQKGAPVQGKGTGGGLKGDPIFTLYNDLVPSADLIVQNLFFFENHSPVDFNTLDPAIPIDSTGIAETNALLDGTGSSQDYPIPSIADGTWFLAQGQVFGVGDSFPSGWFVDGFTTTPTPEPSSVLLLLLGGALVKMSRRSGG
jgi:hypothetical protein